MPIFDLPAVLTSNLLTRKMHLNNNYGRHMCINERKKISPKFVSAIFLKVEVLESLFYNSSHALIRDSSVLPSHKDKISDSISKVNNQV